MVDTTLHHQLPFRLFRTRLTLPTALQPIPALQADRTHLPTRTLRLQRQLLLPTVRLHPQATTVHRPAATALRPRAATAHRLAVATMTLLPATATMILHPPAMAHRPAVAITVLHHPVAMARHPAVAIIVLRHPAVMVLHPAIAIMVLHPQTAMVQDLAVLTDRALHPSQNRLQTKPRLPKMPRPVLLPRRLR